MNSAPTRRRIIDIESLVLSEVEKELRNTNEKNNSDHSKLTLETRSILFKDIMSERCVHHYESLLDMLSLIKGDLGNKELVTLEIYRSPLRNCLSIPWDDIRYR